jgi:hypothetical protein
MKIAVIALLLLTAAARSYGADDLTKLPVETLIDGLTEVDSFAPGLHPTALVLGFIAEDKPLRFGGGVIGATAPVVPPQMRELARRGVAALPQLINHLDDKRPTKLTVGANFFTFRRFSDEYDPKARPRALSMMAPDEYMNLMRTDFRGGYTVKVGDVCYAIIGQIVNRNMCAVRYQPSAGLIVNSPIEAPILIDNVKKDWAGLDAEAHKASLIADAQSGTILWTFGPALTRLRFYYPDEYDQLKTGILHKKITEFESDEATQAQGPKGPE